MLNFFKNKTVIAVAIILVLTLVFSTVSFVRNGEKATVASNAVNTALTPVQTLFTTAKNGVSNFFTALFHCLDYKNENEILNTQIDKLEQDKADMSDLEAENQRLRELLDLKNSRDEQQSVAATIIGREQSNYFSMYTINKGSMHGVTKNAPVIAVGGLVGYVSEVGTNWSKVITIFDEDCAVAAIVNRTNDQGIVEGNFELAQNGNIQFSFLPDDAAIGEGDFVESSGMGGVFPSGILIGKVISIAKNEQNLSVSAIVEPSVDFERLTELLVIIQ